MAAQNDENKNDQFNEKKTTTTTNKRVRASKDENKINGSKKFSYGKQKLNGFESGLKKCALPSFLTDSVCIVCMCLNSCWFSV